jgi:Domain of unknown function (DUF4382)
MKNIRTLLTLVAFFFLLLLLIVSCKKESSSEQLSKQQNRLLVYLTDNPVAFQNVFIDIQVLEVKVDTCSSSGDDNDHDGDDDDDDDDDNSGSGNSDDDDDDDHSGNNNNDDSCDVWQTLRINPGVYDLLKFRNGVDTLLAQGLIPKGKIKAVRLTLGNRNSVVIDSVVYPLALPHNKVLIKIDHAIELSNGQLKINLDFDLCNSIIRIRDNQFELRPRIKSFDENESGRIEGRVLPREARAIVSAMGDKDTLIALPDDDDGEFKIRGIRSSKVDLLFNATANGYKDTIIKNISITPGKEIKFAAISLHK